MDYLGKLRLTHLGKIFSNLSIAAAVIAILCALSGILTAVAAVVGIVIIVMLLLVTLGLLYIVWPECINVLQNLGSTTEIIPFVMQAFLPAVIVGIVTSLLAVLCLRADPERKWKTKIGFEIAILVVLALLYLAVILKILPIVGETL